MEQTKCIILCSSAQTATISLRYGIGHMLPSIHYVENITPMTYKDSACEEGKVMINTKVL